jgi:uncharacterized protein (DUF2235 family)
MHAVPSLFRQLRLIAKLDFMVSVSHASWLLEDEIHYALSAVGSSCFSIKMHSHKLSRELKKKGRGEMHDSSLVQHVAPSNLCLWTGDSVGSGIYMFGGQILL